MHFNLYLAAKKKRGYRLWLWALIAGLLIWWWLNQPEDERRKPVKVAPSLHREPTERTGEMAEKPEPDDLTLIEGIGPKIRDLLHEKGITTFAQLAASDVTRLTSLLRESKLYMVNPSTWPRQARLAADRHWDSLEALKSDLKGGQPG